MAAGQPAPPTTPATATLPAAAWKGALLGALSAACLHAHLVATPFWQDDFVGIHRALVARDWYAAIVPAEKGTFFRPVSVGLWWWTLTRGGEPSPLVVHSVQLVLFTLAVACVGVLASWVAGGRLGDADASHACGRGFWAALLYGAHNAFFLPLAWGSGAQEVLGLLFSALSLLAWVGWLVRERGVRWMFGALAVLMQVLAHGSKEGTAALAVAVPLVLWLLGGRWPRILAAALVVAVVADLWLQVRSLRVVPPGPGSPYEYVLGRNVLRNGAALLAFAGGMPREAVQLFVAHGDGWALVWGVACLGLFSAGVVVVLGGLGRRPPVVVVAAPLLLFGLSVAPYVPLRWNCYPYYVLFGLMAWPLLVAFSWGDGRRMRIGGALIVASSAYCAMGEHWAPVPAPLARAERAARLRAEMAEALPTLDRKPVLVVWGEDESPLLADLGWRPGLSIVRRDAVLPVVVMANFDGTAGNMSGMSFHEWNFSRFVPGAHVPWNSMQVATRVAVHFQGDRMRLGVLVRWSDFPDRMVRDAQGEPLSVYSHLVGRADGTLGRGERGSSRPPPP